MFTVEDLKNVLKSNVVDPVSEYESLNKRIAQLEPYYMISNLLRDYKGRCSYIGIKRGGEMHRIHGGGFFIASEQYLPTIKMIKIEFDERYSDELNEYERMRIAIDHLDDIVYKLYKLKKEKKEKKDEEEEEDNEDENDDDDEDEEEDEEENKENKEQKEQKEQEQNKVTGFFFTNGRERFNIPNECIRFKGI